LAIAVKLKGGREVVTFFKLLFILSGNWWERKGAARDTLEKKGGKASSARRREALSQKGHGKLLMLWGVWGGGRYVCISEKKETGRGGRDISA